MATLNPEMRTLQSFNLSLDEANIVVSECYSDMDYESALDLVLMQIEAQFNCTLLEWTI